MHEVEVREDYITLGQLLKTVGAIGSGGEAKHYLAEQSVNVNGELENRRGRKLRAGDVVELPDIGTVRLYGSIQENT